MYDDLITFYDITINVLIKRYIYKCLNSVLIVFSILIFIT